MPISSGFGSAALEVPGFERQRRSLPNLGIPEHLRDSPYLEPLPVVKSISNKHLYSLAHPRKMKGSKESSRIRTPNSTSTSMNMSIPDFLINDSYDPHFVNTLGNRLNSVNIISGADSQKKKSKWSPEKKKMLWLWLLLAWLVILGAVLGVLLWYFISGPGSDSPENCPLSICRYGALSCQTTVSSATCTCREPAWIDGTETDPFLFTCSKRTFTNCTENQPVGDCTAIDL
ncbi:Oidioi.mRNA.OKI2018_I69.chr2.g4230.t1.cds [Oikopleura dioica]|uniref:Oidioi.mRNA.OKI2018_I69.chr2.g4230.t1.cds n=1 Tax=Oikopleura dioica TaxID=34765 RepID=A0ABN7T0X3_OIKDI|nr:Oidioi.mRNA.OKI2018_I69.chr2.g4230.t1.cds [Oikopleura dioica]